jgi:hypothetical protein
MLAGCVVPPPGGYPAQAPYYPPPQTSYVPPPPDYPGEQYVYTDGTPYAVVGGQQYVVLFDPGLGWGFYDGYHRWHGAPPRWRDDFERRYPGGRGYAPGPPREANFRPGAPPPGRPGGPPPARPGGEPAAFARPAPAPSRPAAPPPRQAEPRREERPACGVPGTPHC